tara:strand:- start:25 stop:321 length:297 start_codon:yes stop_codon:yes gene_type:complete
MNRILTKKTSCTNSTVDACADEIREKIEAKFNCKLKCFKTENGNLTETHGSIGIVHEINNHKITVRFHETSESANEKHPEPRKKLSKIPTESEIKKII